ncbi:MAG: hypothetical protein LRS49_00110, partial [Desulfurococcales archaeon]|nr:hypothetical protein [Desulfurococcales archaeon]
MPASPGVRAAVVYALNPARFRCRGGWCSARLYASGERGQALATLLKSIFGGRAVTGPRLYANSATAVAGGARRRYTGYKRAVLKLRVPRSIVEMAK